MWCLGLRRRSTYNNYNIRKKIMSRALKFICLVCIALAAFATSCFAQDLNSPKSTVSVAQGVTVASRMHAAENNAFVPTGEQECIDYAISNSLINQEQFDDFTRPIKRYEMAQLISDACGETEYINTVEEIPDVQSTAPYIDHVLKLYRAGIVTGYDDYGTFKPDNLLTRAEMSVMSERASNSAFRVNKRFFKMPRDDAYYIIEAVRNTGPGGLANGWKYDNRFELFNNNGTNKAYISDMSDEKFGALIRDFKEESCGLFRLELMLNISSGEDGVYVAFEDEYENKLFGLKVKDGKLRLFGLSDANEGVEISQSVIQSFAVEMDFSLDDNTAQAYINNTYCGEVSIPSTPVCRLVVGTNKAGVGVVSMNYARLSKNFSVNHRFIAVDNNMGQSPVQWDVTGNFELQNISSMQANDMTSVKSTTKAGESSTAQYSFDALCGKVAFEAMILMPEIVDGASVSLMCGEETAVTFETREGKLYVGNNMVNDYIPNVWQTLYVEADTQKQIAHIYVNGKKRTTINIDKKYFDGVKVSFAPNVDGVMWFDDVEVYNILEHDDYPAQPVVSQSDDYNIGVNVCWLWRDQQSGEGWDSVSAFSEFEPYIGYYDEGLRETADWEIKWLAEHGVDFIHACWYSPSGNLQAPIKEMRTSYAALHDGYMKAKYSNYVDFCIMWENSAQDCTSFEQFREYIWNYWVEYYFKDERYVRLDNKAVLSVFNITNFEKAFGSEEGAREAVQFMNDELVKLGYDGLILMTQLHGGADKSAFTKRKNLGFDSVYAYNWGRKGYDAQYQIQSNSSNALTGTDLLHHIPTVSIGFNDVGRNEIRSPIISVSDHKAVCEYVKEHLGQLNTSTWKDKTLILSTLNEYSEGTYMTPTATTGYEYLENVRKTFTNDTTPHTDIDVIPTSEQIARVTHLYPNNHSPIRWLQNEKSSDELKFWNAIESAVPVRTYDMKNASHRAMWKKNHGLDTFDNTQDGVISGSSTKNDYSIITAELESIDAATSPILHLRMKNDAVASFEVYFISSNNTEWNDEKRYTVPIEKTGQFVDYYVDMTQNDLWKDTITALRIDPQTLAGSFEISYIELLDYDEAHKQPPMAVNVNGVKLNFTFDPKATNDGDYEVVGEARNNGFYSSMRLYYEWDRFTGDGVLTLKTYDENTYVFEVGSDKVTVNGTLQDLGYTFTLYDGLPVFHIKKLCELLGYEYTVLQNAIDIKACSDEELQVLNDVNINDIWDFGAVTDNAGWKSRNTCTAVVNMQGNLQIIPGNNRDVGIMRDVSFDADKYSKIRVGIKYNDALENTFAQMFFITSSDLTYTENKSFKVYYDLDGKTYGDTVEVVFDLTENNLFVNTITGLRFDPFNKALGCEIDYIRCETN